MSRGKNNVGGSGNYRRGNRTLAWYLGDKLLDKVEAEKDASTIPNALDVRKNSIDSQTSSQSSIRQANQCDGGEDRKLRRDRKSKHRRPPSQQPPSQQQLPLNTCNGRPTSEPVGQQLISQTTSENDTTLGNVRESQSPSSLPNPQQFSMVGSGTNTVQTKDRENYWYYDQVSDGFYYEHNGSRGWRKRNPKIHGNPPLTVQRPAEELKHPMPCGTPSNNTVSNTGTHSNSQPQLHSTHITPQPTIEKKVYVPVPIPVFPAGHSSGKFFAPCSAGQNGPNIQYYDAATDGYFYEMASVDGWRRRQPTASFSQMQSDNKQTAPKTDNNYSEISSSSMTAFPPLGRDLTSQELEELVLSKTVTHSADQPTVTPSSLSNNTNRVQFSSVVTRGIKQNFHHHVDNEYPSSLSTASSSISDDQTPPPVGAIPASLPQHVFGAQTKESVVGSFDADEPYEFYWSDNEKVDINAGRNTVEHANSISSTDEVLPIRKVPVNSINKNTPSAYLNELYMQHKIQLNNAAPVKRPNSLKISDTPASTVADKSRFNVDKFIADLPEVMDNERLMRTLTSACTPLSMDGMAFNINHFPVKDSPLFTPALPQASVWDRYGVRNACAESKTADSAAAEIERGLRDIEKIWQTGF